MDCESGSKESEQSVKIKALKIGDWVKICMMVRSIQVKSVLLEKMMCKLV